MWDIYRHWELLVISIVTELYLSLEILFSQAPALLKESKLHQLFENLEASVQIHSWVNIELSLVTDIPGLWIYDIECGGYISLLDSGHKAQQSDIFKVAFTFSSSIDIHISNIHVGWAICTNMCSVIINDIVYLLPPLIQKHSKASNT